MLPTSTNLQPAACAFTNLLPMAYGIGQWANPANCKWPLASRVRAAEQSTTANIQRRASCARSRAVLRAAAFGVAAHAPKACEGGVWGASYVES
eukprot:scaffold23_cov113-Isochrysis_galbana.AAC.2